jgi:hypothetical protein
MGLNDKGAPLDPEGNKKVTFTPKWISQMKTSD